MEKLINGVWEYSLNNPYGFTLNLKTMQAVEYGISVAYLETQDSFGKEDLIKVINHSLNHQSFVGGWFNSENNQYYFDSVKIFKNSELKEAIQFAKENKQIAIFDITNKEEIIIEG